MSYKTDRDRTTDKPAYDSCPLWGHIDAKKGKAKYEDIKRMSSEDIVSEANRISGGDPDLNEPGAYTRYDKLIKEWMSRNPINLNIFNKNHKGIFKPDNEKVIKHTRIFNDNKHLIDGSNVVLSREDRQKLSLEILDEYAEACEELAKGPEGAHILNPCKVCGHELASYLGLGFCCENEDCVDRFNL